MANIMTKRGAQDNVITYEHYCDTKADLANIPKSQITLGSTAVVLQDDDGSLGVYIAGSDKQWISIMTTIGGSDAGPNLFKNLVEGTLTDIHDDTIQTVIYGLRSNPGIKHIQMDEATKLSLGAFNGCTKLLTASFPKCTEIADGELYITVSTGSPQGGTMSVFSPNGGAFMGCNKLISVDIENCKKIGSIAFSNCAALEDVNAPLCESLGYGAFYNCTNLKTAIFPKVETVQESTFANCTNLSTIDFAECQIVGENAFFNCNSLQELSFPKCLEIGSSSTDGRSNYNNSWELPSNPNYGFAFNRCINVNKADFPLCKSIHDGLTMTREASQGGMSRMYTRQGMFGENTKLSEINFPEVEYVGVGAFCSCTSLISVNLPACTVLQRTAFAGCTNLETINLPACITIGDAWPSTTTYYIPSKGAFIGAFGECTSLKNVSLPMCQEVGGGAFTSCTMIENINLPECISVGKFAFGDCLQLKEIHLPKLQALNSDTFTGCYNLVSVYLDSCSVITNGGLVQFRQRAELDVNCDFYFLSNNVVQCSEQNSFIYNGNIYVPESLVSLYISDSGWSRFSEHIVAYSGE